MSEAPKFDLSRLRVGNFANAVKADGISNQKTNTPDKVKLDEIAEQKTNSSDAAKLDEVAEQKTNSPETIKLNEIAEQKTNSPETIKLNEIAEQKTNSPETIKLNEIAEQKTNSPETTKLNEIAKQKNKLSSGEPKNLDESAKEIKQFLVPLQTTYPTNSDYEKQVFVNKFREEIRSNYRVQEILVAGGTELIKIICQPLNIPIEMGKKWLETAKHYR